MSYQVDFDLLGRMNSSLSQQAGQLQEALVSLNGGVEQLAGSPYMSGEGAESIRAYLGSVHNVTIALLGQLLTLHAGNALLYKQDYFSSIDSDLHAYIDQNQLLRFRERVQAQEDAAVVLGDRLQFALGPVRDIFSFSGGDVGEVVSMHRKTTDFLEKLDQDITALEQRHLSSDFNATGEMIRNLRSFIQEQKSHPRDYKTTFTPEKLASSAAFLALYNSYLAVEKELDEKAPAIEKAVENENQRIAQLQAEYEAYQERKKHAERQKWAITGVCIVGSIAAVAVIVASGGTATPLVVGAVSAVSGAVMAGGHAMADQYAEHGNILENGGSYDWGSVLKSAAIGGATGFVTGYLGAGVSQAVTSGLSSTAAGSAMLNSTNAFTRIGTGAAIGSVSQVSSGIVTRGAGTMIATGDVDQAIKDAFNLKSIAFDAAMGGVTGGIEASKRQPDIKIDADKQRYQEETGWSDDIVDHIDSNEQYDIYNKADLSEGEVNGRTALMKDIDYDYVDEKTGLTNRELMEKGRAPYDAKTGEKIELHHMGQDYDGPFAELCENSEHGDGNHSILHPKTDNSWRNTGDLKYQYQRERIDYWKTRSLGGK